MLLFPLLCIFVYPVDLCPVYFLFIHLYLLLSPFLPLYYSFRSSSNLSVLQSILQIPSRVILMTCKLSHVYLLEEFPFTFFFTLRLNHNFFIRYRSTHIFMPLGTFPSSSWCSLTLNPYHISLIYFLKCRFSPTPTI